jgi:hypothetical protein
MYMYSSYGWCAAWALWPKPYLGRSIFFMHEDPSYGRCAVRALLARLFWPGSFGSLDGGQALLAKVLWMVRCTGALAKVLGEACSLCMRIHLMDGALRSVLYAWDFVSRCSRPAGGVQGAAASDAQLRALCAARPGSFASRLVDLRSYMQHRLFVASCHLSLSRCCIGRCIKCCLRRCIGCRLGSCIGRCIGCHLGVSGAVSSAVSGAGCHLGRCVGRCIGCRLGSCIGRCIGCHLGVSGAVSSAVSGAGCHLGRCVGRCIGCCIGAVGTVLAVLYIRCCLGRCIGRCIECRLGRCAGCCIECCLGCCIRHCDECLYRAVSGAVLGAVQVLVSRVIGYFIKCANAVSGAVLGAVLSVVLAAVLGAVSGAILGMCQAVSGGLFRMLSVHCFEHRYGCLYSVALLTGNGVLVYKTLHWRQRSAGGL